MPVIITLLALVIASFYFFLIFAFFIGWLRTKRYIPDQKPPITRVSILIPCRNEEDNIRELATLLNNQDYPLELLEVIWIDDHSTDGTDPLITEQIHTLKNRHLIKLTDQVTGKKAALKAGMELASGELILLTDADSRPGTRWVKTMAKFFEETGIDLILGPVVLDPAYAGFDKIQKLEYLSLVASSVGAAGIGHPVMAQGPNIAVRSADYRILVNNLNNRFASGDDVFLLQSMKKVPEKKVGYVLNPDATVRSKPAESLSGFLLQRRRWASKATGYQDPFLILITLLVFTTNLVILAALVCALWGVVPFYLFLILLGIKTLADLPLLCTAMRFFRCTHLLVWLIPVQIVYPVYIIVAGILSQFTPVRWKNREGIRKT